MQTESVPCPASSGHAWPEEGPMVAKPQAEVQMQPQASPASRREDISAPQLQLANPRFTLAPPSHQPQPWQRLRVPWESLGP